MKCLLLPVIAWLTIVLSTVATMAESRFGTVMKKHYGLRSVSCYSCHVKGEEKDVLNSFGKDLDKVIEGKQLSEKLAQAKEADAEEKEKIYEDVEKEFLAALKKFDQVKAPSGKPYAEAIRAGEIEGIKPRD